LPQLIAYISPCNDTGLIMTLAEIEVETRSQINARRNYLAGLWAARELGIGAEERSDYVRSVMMSDYEEPGIGDVVRKLAGDFRSKGLKIDPAGIEQRLREFERSVRAELLCTD
jgi:hypothetical protein